jgi:hypothetical protein
MYITPKCMKNAKNNCIFTIYEKIRFSTTYAITYNQQLPIADILVCRLIGWLYDECIERRPAVLCSQPDHLKCTLRRLALSDVSKRSKVFDLSHRDITRNNFYRRGYLSTEGRIKIKWRKFKTMAFGRFRWHCAKRKLCSEKKNII